MLILTIGALTVMLILLGGVMETVQFCLRHERETEMLFRGQQIVQAMAQYQRLTGRAARRPGRLGTLWPTWEEFQKLASQGIELPGSTRRIHLVRPFALRDPIEHDRPWKPVGRGDPALRAFLRAYFEYIGRPMPPVIKIFYLGESPEEPDDRRNQNLAPRERNLPGIAPERTREQSGPDAPRAFARAEAFRSEPIFGVRSQSPGKPIRDYYGLERYRDWVFVYIPELLRFVPTEEEKRIQMLIRDPIFPSDPLNFFRMPLSRPLRPFRQAAEPKWNRRLSR